MVPKAWLQRCKTDLDDALFAGNLGRAERLILDYQAKYKGRPELDHCILNFRKVSDIVNKLSQFDKQIEHNIGMDSQNYTIKYLQDYLLCISNDGSLLSPLAKKTVKKIIEELRNLKPESYPGRLTQSEIHEYEDRCKQALHKIQKTVFKLIETQDANWWNQNAYDHAEQYVQLFQRKLRHYIRISYAALDMHIEAYIIAEDDFLRFHDKLAAQDLKKAHVLLQGVLSESIYELKKELSELNESNDATYEKLDDALRKHSDRLALTKKEIPKFYEEAKEVIEIQSLSSHLQQRKNIHRKIVGKIRTVKNKPFDDALNRLDGLADSVGEFPGLLLQYNKLRKWAEDGLCNEVIPLMQAFSNAADKCILSSNVADVKELYQKASELYISLLEPKSERGIKLCRGKHKSIYKKYHKSLTAFAKKYDLLPASSS